jgi:hypothetical protein
MKPSAVTEEAPAVSARESNSNFLPTDKNYRLTGEMPEKLESAGSQRVDPDEHIPALLKEEQDKENQQHQDSSVNDDASAASKSETAAASEAASTQKEKGPAQSKDERTGESRWAKITRENREMRARESQLRERLARLEAAKTTSTSTETQRDTKQESLPATDGKSKGRAEPQIEDTDPKTGKAKYATLKDYLADHSKWNREEAVREFREESSKTERERQQAQYEEVIEKTVNARVKAVRQANPDYDDVAAAALAVKDDLGRDALFYSKGSPIDGFFLDSDRGHDVLYQIFKDFDKHQHIFARDARGNYLLNPVRQLRELAKIEHSLPDKSSTGKSASASSATRVTQAPRPPHQVSGKGTVSKDAVEEAVEEGGVDGTERYIREQNARALARLKKG